MIIMDLRFFFGPEFVYINKLFSKTRQSLKNIYCTIQSFGEKHNTPKQYLISVKCEILVRQTSKGRVTKHAAARPRDEASRAVSPCGWSFLSQLLVMSRNF